LVLPRAFFRYNVFMKNLRENILKYGTYLAVLLTPLLCFGQRYLSFSSSKTFFFYGVVEILLAVWLYSLYIDRSYRLSKKDIIIFVPFLAFVFWLTIAGILGPDFETSFWSSLSRGTGLLTMYHITAFVFIVSSLVKKNGLDDYGYKLLSWFIGGTTILALSVWFGNEGFNIGWKLLEKSKGGGFMGNSSLTATVLIFTIFISLFLVFAKNIQKKFKVLLLIVIGLIIFSPLFINLFGLPISARGALAGIGVGVISFVAFLLALSKKRIGKIIGVFLIVIGVIGFVFSWSRLMMPDTSIHQKFAELATESRFIFWQSAGSAIKDNPMFGLGPENFRIAEQKYFNPRLYEIISTPETWSDRAHNIIFDTGVNGGYPAIILYFSFLLSLFYGLYRAFMKGRITRFQTATLSALIVAYFIQNLFVFDSIVSLVSLAIITGLVFGVSSDGEISDKIFNKPSKDKSQFVIVLIILLFIPTWIFFTWRPARKAENLDRVIGLSLNKRPDHYVDLLKGSVVGNAFEIGAIADDAYHLYADNESTLKSNAKTLPYALNDLEKFTSYLETVSKSEPYDLHLKFNLARLYNVYMDLSGKYTDATLVNKVLAIENESIEMSPNDPQHYWVKIITQFKSGDIEGAQETARKALDIAPNIELSKEFLDKMENSK
jgi:O-antigen ligase